MSNDNITAGQHNPDELIKENRALKRQLRNLESTLQRNKAMLAARTTINTILETEQKKMERNMNLLLENSADMILLFDMDGCFAYVSDTFVKATGIIGAGIIIGKHFTDVFTEEISQEWSDFIEQNLALAMERRNTVIVNSSVDLSGGREPKDYDIQITPLIDYQGGQEAFMMLLHDTTEIINSKRQAESASLSKSQFLATMSHEIRTPMNAILGITEIQLQREELDPDVREALGKIYTSGDLLLGIINDILDLSKIEAGKLEFTIDRYEVASVISDTAQLNMMRIGSKPIEFVLDVDPDVPASLSGDELRVKQIFNNILSNAFKYTASGTVGLSLTAEPAEGNGDLVTLVVRVSDTGQGISKEQLEKLFDDYSRFNMEANRSTEGTGLGMSITRNMVRLMNGSISVDSEPGKGSVFTVRLPQGRVGSEKLGMEMAENLQQFRANTLAQMKRAQITREPMPYGRVLIVDDVETNIYVAKGLMAPYELKIDEAISGFAAIDIIKKGNVYDVIFMDHMMPKMDGIEATKIIRSMGYKKPIVALTANAVTGQAEIFLGSGFDDFISKPIDIRLLNSVLNKLVRDKQPQEVVEKARKQALKKSEQAGDAPLPVTDPIFAEIFVRDAQKAIDILEALHGKSDYDDEDNLRAYIINVHGMKSALANIGKKDLSAIALKLETAGRDGRIDTIKSETANFLTFLKAYLEEIKPPEDAAAGDSADEDKQYLKEKLQAIKAACEDYDESVAEEALTELRSVTWSQQTNELLGDISEKLLHSDFSEIETVVNDFLETMQP